MTELEACAALDARVAVEVMGWEPLDPVYGDRSWWKRPDGDTEHFNWSPSTDWAAAGQVVEKLREEGASWNLCNCFDAESEWWDAELVGVSSEGATLPLAICRAALAAKEAGDD